jgi:hypothetical protein
MKNLALLVAVALLALAVPASAGETSDAAFLATLAQQVEVPLSPFNPGLKGPCHLVDSRACTSAGATTVCLDGCGFQVTCVCTTYAGNQKYWRCGWQC